MRTAKISSKSQIVIPADVRRELGLLPGDNLGIRVDGESIVLTKQPASWLKGLEPFRGDPVWKGYAAQVLRERAEGDDR